MGLIGSVTKNDTPCEFFYEPIMGQLEEIEGHINDIMGPEAVAHGKAIIRDVQATRRKEVYNIQLSNIWVISEELVSKDIANSTQLCKHHANNSLSQQLSNNNIMLQHRRINSVFFTDTLLSQTTLSTRKK